MKLLNKVYMLGFASLLGLTLTGCGSTSKLELKKETFKVEYGEVVSTNAKEYLVKDTEKEVIKDTKVKFKKLENEKDKEFPAIDEYKGTATYKEEKVSFTVKVEDTIAPEFVDFSEVIEVEQGYSEDIATKFKATDLSEVTIKADTSKVDFNVVGEYEIKVTAKDKYKNKTTKTAKVKVVEKKVEEQPAENNNETTNNSVNNATGNNTNNVVSGGNSSTGSTNPPANNTGGSTSGNTAPAAPYITDDGRSYKYNPNTLIDISMQSPLFNTDDEAFAWAYASSYWTTNRYGFETVSVLFSDGSEKVSVSWYN